MSASGHILPAIVLFVLSPAIGELLSGSSPPAEFFHPVRFLLLSALYGSGAILVRELTVCWQKGWFSLFLLGAAYGIIEEGLCCKSFFDPNWPDVGILGTYGRWLGVNWVWTFLLTIYHAVYSIAIPITLVELIFRERRGETWVSRKALTFLALLLSFITVVGFQVLPHPARVYRVSLLPVVLTIGVVISLFFLARQLPVPHSSDFVNRQVPRPFWFLAVGFLGTLLLFIFFGGLPKTKILPVITILLGLGITIIVAILVWNISGYGRLWSDLHRLALISGALGFFILLAPFHELANAKRPDNTAGMTAVGLATFILLLWLKRRLKQM
ncbi:MAG: hypothetical protein PHR77_00440 [Kiritimatiellae bacterium]|nr:hypothetical protein [Kiritimatiellia bacterium]MDD5519849.1 hypothetical protein [Kiritimatiellia bacterium]